MAPIYLLKRQKVKHDVAQATNAQTISTKETRVSFEDQCSGDKESLYKFLSLHVLQGHAATTHNEILDSGSTITLAKDKNVFRSLRPCDENIVMATNAGSERIRQ